MRMFDEVAKTLEVANYITEKTGIKPICHIDASLPIKKNIHLHFPNNSKVMLYPLVMIAF
jgi:hypothetical protein